MKSYKILLVAGIVGTMGLGLVSCSDDDLFTRDGKEAFILGSGSLDCLKVVGKSGMVWKSRMEDDMIYIQVSPTVDPAEELDGVVATFFVSKGASVVPDPSEPQNFAREGGVQYTVTSEDGSQSRTYTVTHGLTDIIEYGQGFTNASATVARTFAEMGYPGEKGNFNLADSRQYGDLNGYLAFCGHDHLLLFARQYADPHFDNAALNVADKDLSFKVFNKTDLSEAGILNIGSVPMASFKAFSSDDNGVLIGIANAGGGSADIYYWRSYSETPTLLAHINENMCGSADGSNYVQVQGDIFNEANITGNGTRNKTGDHYMIHIENASATNIQTISTGYPSDDSNGFQMISPLRTDVNSSYLIGDVEGSGNNTLKVYASTYGGKTKVIMPNVLQNDWQAWWVGTGANLARTGARRPYVTSMLINGKHYASVMLGTGWWWHNDIVIVDDLHTRIASGTTVAYSINASWSFGGSSDWYWDPDAKEAYWATYTDRVGVNVVRLTCYE